MSAVRCIRRAGASYVARLPVIRTHAARMYVRVSGTHRSIILHDGAIRANTYTCPHVHPVVFTFTLSAIGRESRCTPIRSARADRAVPACPCAHALSIARSAMSSGQRVVMLSCPLDLSDNWLSLTGITRRKADTGSTYARSQPHARQDRQDRQDINTIAKQKQTTTTTQRRRRTGRPLMS